MIFNRTKSPRKQAQERKRQIRQAAKALRPAAPRAHDEQVILLLPEGIDHDDPDVIETARRLGCNMVVTPAGPNQRRLHQCAEAEGHDVTQPVIYRRRRQPPVDPAIAEHYRRSLTAAPAPPEDP